MMRVQRFGVILLIALLLVLALAACGDTAPTAEPVDVAKQFEEANALARAGEFDKAIAAYKLVLGADPENVSALTNLGVAYYSTGNLEESISSYLEALEVSSEDDADIRSNLAAAYVQTGKFENALEQYQKAVELKPELAEAHFGLGVVYVQLQDSESAIAAFLKFQEVDTGSDVIATEQAQQYLDQLRGQ